MARRVNGWARLSNVIKRRGIDTAAICQEANLTTSLARDQCDVEHINKTELVAINVCCTSDSLTVQSRL